MNSLADLLIADRHVVPKVPVWARPRGLVLHDVDAAYLAGAALNSLDNLVRQDFAWAGAWRQRLALRSAVAAAQLSGRREDEAALRDSHYLRGAGDDPGPSGHLLLAWRKLAICRTSSCDEETVRPVAEQQLACSGTTRSPRSWPMPRTCCCHRGRRRHWRPKSPLPSIEPDRTPSF